ncbi:uncharacterized protein K452DRAFT_294095 [Aplosporella prunicola CBS 121167]|uniref:Uncharacterized protein n=1 Tax=Aplosporella prunicola CBS 121167 TaxID=1176127 RepID=A0A6A6BR93_9PEZI|nr:uncharacterized protein K452DRAFT_294095 [Aplosporella prunicola CBS 121167]KAF2146530.1 hypothetical protein K452DRAFT_294095 [Aplosporella prunicola CBS 121167]
MPLTVAECAPCTRGNSPLATFLSLRPQLYHGSVESSSVSRQELLNALTVAVDAVHAAAPRTLADYIARPMTNVALSKLLLTLRQGTDGPKWALQMSKESQALLRDLIVKAKTQYATYLRARDKSDVKVIWAYNNNLRTISTMSRREIWLFVESVYDRRYMDHSDRLNFHKGFSVVLDNHEVERFRDLTSEWPVLCVENIPRDFAPAIDTSNLRSWEELYSKAAETLHDIRNTRFEAASGFVPRGNEAWFPFPNVVRKSTEHIAPSHHLEREKKLDHLNNWDVGKPRDLTRKGGRDHTHLRRYTNAHSDNYNPLGTLPPHWVQSKMQEQDSTMAESQEARAQAEFDLPPASGLLNRTVPYNRTRRQPPEEYRIQVSTPLSASEDSGSVAVASLGSVVGKLKRMKSFVRKPSKAEPSGPTAALPDLKQKPPADAFTPPSSDPSRSTIPARPQQQDNGLNTPPDSNSTGSTPRLEMPAKNYKRRVPTAATRRRVITPRQCRATLRSCSSRESLQSKTTSSTLSRDTSTTSIDLTPIKGSVTDVHLLHTLPDSPSPNGIWRSPLDPFERPRKQASPSLAALSPTKQAAAVVQHIDVISTRPVSPGTIVMTDPYQATAQVVTMTEKARERADSGNSTGQKSALQALLNATPRKAQEVF